MLRTELVRWLSTSKELHIHQLITLEEMGKRKPFQFLRYLRSLTPDVPDDFLCCIWSSRIPPNVQAILAGQPEGDLDAAHAVQSTSSRLHPCQRSRALQFCSISKAFPTRWQQSAPSVPIFATAAGTAAWAADPPSEMMLHPLSASIITTTEPRSKSVLSFAPTTSRETNTADINGGTCRHYNHRSPLHDGQD
jgi:hypothetical protein